MKVGLLHEPDNRGYQNPRQIQVSVKKSLPFFKSGQGLYVHRVRSGRMYFNDGEYSHTAWTLWCGMRGFGSSKHKGSTLLQEPPNGSPVCATCEGRAIGAGQLGTHEIAGRLVLFSPKCS